MAALDLEYMLGLVPVILRYVPLTLGMALAAMAIALVLASVLAVVRVLKVPVVDRFVALFISFFRGTPLLVQLFLFYYGLPQVFSALTAIDGVTAAIMGLTLHFSAYMAESIRGAITGIDRSQWEASHSVGMTQLQAMRRIILPQAARIAASAGRSCAARARAWRRSAAARPASRSTPNALPSSPRPPQLLPGAAAPIRYW
jgi:putative amino-acid transport system permease protein